MNRKIAVFLIVAAFASCTERAVEIQSPSVEEGICSLTVSVAQEKSETTRAVQAYTASKDYETAVRRLQIFVFDSEGKLNAYSDAGNVTSKTLDVSYGTKDVWAVVNGEDLSGVMSKSELLSTEVLLGKNSVDPAKGFVMSGNTSLTLSGTTATAPITVSRLASRVALVSVTNNLPSAYGNFTVLNAFLANVVGNENIAGTASPTIWYNKEGRSDSSRSSVKIINGDDYDASEPGLTFKQISEDIENDAALDMKSSPYLMYAYKNSSTVNPTGYHDTFTAQRTALIVTVEISAGNTYYYPVVLNSLERNKAYTVALTINGLGSKDPDTPISKGAITANISVAGWTSGAVYDESI